jgi:hypothetical protein
LSIDGLERDNDPLSTGNPIAAMGEQSLIFNGAPTDHLSWHAKFGQPLTNTSANIDGGLPITRRADRTGTYPRTDRRYQLLNALWRNRIAPPTHSGTDNCI